MWKDYDKFWRIIAKIIITKANNMPKQMPTMMTMTNNSLIMLVEVAMSI